MKSDVDVCVYVPADGQWHVADPNGIRLNVPLEPMCGASGTVWNVYAGNGVAHVMLTCSKCKSMLGLSEVA